MCQPGVRKSKIVTALVVGGLAIHAALLAWIASGQSPTWDEVAHLPAGISHLKFGDFVLYRVNPPLVRAIAAVPVTLTAAETPLLGVAGVSGGRPEFWAGALFVQANAPDTFRLFTLARWACIPFSLIGAYVCFRWARELYGDWAGVTAMGLWCFSPTVLGYGALITPDCGAAALGVAAAYAFWHWLRGPNWTTAFWAGLLLGLAELTKFTWIVLFVLWPLLWIVWRLGKRQTGTGREPAPRSLADCVGRPFQADTDGPEGPSYSRASSPFPAAWRREAGQLAFLLLLAVYVLNLGYGFEGSFQRLGDFRFVSKTLAGPDEQRGDDGAGNRFADSWLAAMPMPVPKNYLLGIDVQKVDFERKMPSYLRGEWRLGGWWYYYLYALLIKEPLGTWTLAALAAGVGLFARGYAAGWRDELVLLAPIAVVVALVSSQTGFNHHVRYVLPALPFAFVWMSKVARSLELHHRAAAAIAAAAFLWSVGSSLYCYPHSLSYFNELVGGPKGGHYHLGNSNADWGQDLFFLKRWLDEHPEAQPLKLAYDMPLVDPRLAGTDYDGAPPGNAPEPGWHALSVNQIHRQSGDYEYFLRFEPAGMAGYSIYIYHITAEDARRVRRELDLAELPEPSAEAAEHENDE
jgi:hypothetical protein